MPTISECFAYFYPNERGVPRPSSINETKPSKTLNKFKYSVSNINSHFQITLQLFVFLVKTSEVYVMETVVVRSYGKISPIITKPMYLASY